MKKFKQILWLLLGIVLMFLLFSGQAEFVDSHTIDLIDQARQLHFEDDWPGYRPEIYPVEIYKKNLLRKDSIVRYDQHGIYEINDKTPVYALSMDIDPDGQAVLLVTTARDFRSLSDVGNFDGPSAELYYQAVIIHEAFHCFQADQGFYDVFSEKVSAYEKSNALTIARKLDDDPEYQKLWVEEMQCLIHYAGEDNSQNHLAYLGAYQNAWIIYIIHLMTTMLTNIWATQPSMKKRKDCAIHREYCFGSIKWQGLGICYYRL